MPSTRTLTSARARGRDRAAGPPPRPGVPRAPAGERAPQHGGRREWVWPAALGAIGFAALLFACRGAPLGTPVADDYYFLHTLAFQKIHIFDSMGVPYYWRPLSRQAYFLATGHWMILAPWGIALLHMALLSALLVLIYRSARYAVAPPLAAAIAFFPLASEPARVLLSWPSGGQHLLPALFAAATLHETLEGRRWTAGLAALAAALSHETGVFAIPLVPLVAWFRSRRLDETMRFGLAAAIAGAAWALGYSMARRGGVELPGGQGGPLPLAMLPGVFEHGLISWLNLEDLPAATRATLFVCHGALLVAAIAVMIRPLARARIAALLPAIAGSVAWAAMGTALLVYVLPDWNGWRAWVPSIGFGVAVTLLLGAAAQPLAAGFVLLRLVALLLAPEPPAVVATEPPKTTSKFSFPRLTRLQLTVESTRRALRDGAPALPRGAAVRYWTVPRYVMVGFQDERAAQVWYRDTTLTWGSFGGVKGITMHVDAMLEYVKDERSPATVIPPAALQAFQEAMVLLDQNRIDRADSLMAAAEGVRGVRRGPFLSTIALNRAIVAFTRGQIAVADSLVQRALDMNPQLANAWLFSAKLAAARGDREAAIPAVLRCLAIDPQNAEGRRIAAALGLR